MNYKTPEELKYTKEHEWTSMEPESATIGITDFAQSALGDIVFVELPEVGSTISKGESFGVVESIKSVSDLYAPLTGKVIAKNDQLEESPELLNQDPYKNWMVKIEVTNENEISELLSKEVYEKLQVEQ